jgi:GTP-binding protein
MVTEMKIRSTEIKMSATKRHQYPAEGLPEIALVGRSNVGKSSCVNALLNRRNFARTSQTPGKTRTINFYLINNEFYFVDLPGYGYAKVSEEIKAKWGQMIERYLNTSPMLKAVFLLIDIRHEPSANDRNMYDWIIHNGFQPIIIATKLDKIKRSQVQKQVKLIRTGLDVVEGTPIIPFSAETKQGREEIWELIEEFCNGNY